MPTVPSISGPSVQSRAIPNVGINARSTARDFGSNVGKAISQTGDLLTENAAKMKAEDDQAKIKEATNIFRQKINERAWTDEDAYYNRKGNDAYESLDGMGEELDKVRQEITHSLKPGRQQKIFGDIAKDYLMTEHEQMSSHAVKGRSAWLNEQDEATIIQAQEDGSLRWIDNTVYKNQINKAVSTLAKRNGWSPEKTDLERERFLTGMHKTAIDNILATDPSVADEYFEAHKEEIAGSLHNDIKLAIDQQVDSVWVQGQADVIRLGGGTRTERLDAVREATENDPDRRKLLTNQVEHDIAQEKVAGQETQLAAYDQGVKAVISGQSVAQFIEGNRDAWNAMSGTQQASITAISKKPNTSRPTDLGVYYEIRGLIGAGNKDQAREILLNKITSLSLADAKGFMDEIFTTPKDSEGKNALTDTSHFNDWSETFLGREPSKGDGRKTFNKRRNIIFGMYQDGLDQWKAENEGKKVVPHAERQSILDQMSIKMNKKDGGFMWFDKEVDISTIPIEDVDQIKEALIAQGNPVTPENILLFYTHDPDVVANETRSDAAARRRAEAEIRAQEIRDSIN